MNLVLRRKFSFMPNGGGPTRRLEHPRGAKQISPLGIEGELDREGEGSLTR